MNRPFRILGINHIAIGTSDRQKMRPLWENAFGAKVDRTFVSESENVEEDVYLLGEYPYRVQIDVMQPIDSSKEAGVAAFPLNHIAFWVDDLASAVEWMTDEGIRFTPGGIRKGAAGFDICFIHPKGDASFPISGEGTLIELVQAPPDLIQPSESN